MAIYNIDLITSHSEKVQSLLSEYTAKNKADIESINAEAQNKPAGNIFSPIGKPIAQNIITQRFGKADPSLAGAYPGGIHNGLDIDITQGDNIYAVKNAKVTSINPSTKGYGGTIEITDDQGYTYLYGHLSDTNAVKVGDVVNAGQIIAKGGGDKGTKGAGFSTGSHLHFSISKKGAGTVLNKYNETIDPMEFIKSLTTK